MINLYVKWLIKGTEEVYKVKRLSSQAALFYFFVVLLEFVK